MKTIEIKEYYTFSDLWAISDSMTTNILLEIAHADKKSEFMDFICEAFKNSIPDICDLQEYLINEKDDIFAALDIKTRFYIDELDAEAYDEALREVIIELSPYNKIVDAIRCALPDASDKERKTLYKQIEVAANAECLFFTAEGAIIAD